MTAKGQKRFPTTIMITTQQIIITIMITMMIVMIRIIIMITFIKNDDNESNGRIMMVRMTMVM